MKKFFTCKLLLFALVIFGWTSSVNAQDYRTVKHWDLLTWSAETVENLNADPTNWTGTDADPETTAWQRHKSAKENPAVLVANEVEIAETKGLEFPILAAGNVTIRHNFGGNGLQLGKDNQWITIKNLKKDQKVIIALKSASTTSARGISAVTNMTGEVGESTWSTGGATVTYEFTVNEDGDGKLQYNSGIILQDIKVSEVAKKVAFIYQENYSPKWSVSADQIRSALEELYVVTDIVYPNATSEASDVVNTAMQAILDANYDLIVISEAIGGTNSYGVGLKSLVGKVPMLNMKSYFYNSGRWSWGTGQNPTKGTISLEVQNAYKEHPIFSGVTIGEDGSCPIFSESVSTENQLQAYVSPTSVISGDPVLAKIGDYYAIHEHISDGETVDYRYILIPISSDAMNGKISDTGLKLVMNTARYLVDRDYQIYAQAEAPVISSAQNGNLVTITITCATEGASVYYTLDGETPTTSASLYTGAFDIAKSCTIKAIAIKENMKNSVVVSEDIVNPNYVSREKTLLWADFNEQPSPWGIIDNIFAAGSSGEHQYAGFTVGSDGQRVNLQTTGVSEEVGVNYGPATETDAGATKYAMSFLTGGPNAYIITPTVTGPFDVTIWWCGANSTSLFTESLTISVKTAEDGDWTEIGTLSTTSLKKIVKRSVSYNGNETVAVKVASSSTNGTNNNAMIFDLKLMGEGADTGIADNVNNDNKVVVAKEYYDLMGRKLSSKEAAPVNAILIEKSVYEDGSVGIKKIH